MTVVCARLIAVTTAAWRIVGAAAILMLAGCAALLPQSEAVRIKWPAALADRIELTEVPFFAQQDYQCGPAALAMVLGVAGLDVTPDALVPKVYLPQRQGSLQVEMVAAPRSYGRVSWRLAPRLEDVLREVEHGTPVVVLQDYGLWPVRIWHYAVIVGFDRATAKVVLRSGDRQRLELPLAVLEYTWKPSGYWSMVALAPDRIAATASEAEWAEAVAAMERVADRSAARTGWRTLLARWPSSLTGAIGLANMAYAERHLDEAEQVLRRALSAHPDSAVALNNLAQVLSERGQHAEALQLADAAIARGGALRDAIEQTRAQIVRRMEGGRGSNENATPTALSRGGSR
jgi:hypothetical protein